MIENTAENAIKKAKCEYCRKLFPITKFGGYLHYASTKEILDVLVQKELYTETHPNSFETYYRCMVCNTTWVLAKPDFPAAGYLIRLE